MRPEGTEPSRQDGVTLSGPEGTERGRSHGSEGESVQPPPLRGSGSASPASRNPSR